MMKIKWCKSFYTLDFCENKVKELHATNKYKRVWHTKYKCQFDGKYYGRIWLEY